MYFCMASSRSGALKSLPSNFIPILEDSGKIVEVGHWVLQAAIAQARRWMDLGYAQKSTAPSSWAATRCRASCSAGRSVWRRLKT
jgi:EAL domain-containing protein (putative c-di-GMP-specific phosphodiesterase class I)